MVSYQAVIAVLTAVTIIIAVTSVVPAMMGDIMIEVPEEDDIEWSMSGSELLVEADMWINNSGNYDLKDIDISIALKGLDTDIFNHSKKIDSVKSGEDRRIPISLTKNFDEFTDEQKETFIFNETTFQITSTMTAVYPFKLLGFDLDYDHDIEWTGIVEDITFQYDSAKVSSDSDTGSTLTLPYEVSTYDGLSGSSDVSITMYNEDGQPVDDYGETIPLGQYHHDEFRFELDRTETEDFITRSQTVDFIAEISMSEGADPFEYEASYDWGAPLNNLDIGDVTYEVEYNATTQQFEGTATAELSFENDSPRKLDITLILIARNDTSSGNVGTGYYELDVSSDSYYSEDITMDLLGVPDEIEVQFEEYNTGMEYETTLDAEGYIGGL